MTNDQKLKEAAHQHARKKYISTLHVVQIDAHINGFIEGAKRQQQQAPDIEEVRNRFIDSFKPRHFSAASTEGCLNKIFDFFAPLIKGSGSVVTVELLDKMIESEKYGAEEYIQDLGNSEGAERCFAKIEILEELKELFTQTKKG